MGLIFVTTMIAIIILVMVWRDEWNDWFEKIIYSVGVALVWFLGTVLLTIIVSGITCMSEVEMTYTKADEQPIYAFKDNTMVEGNHFLFSGYVDEELHYFYVVEDELGYHTEKVDADDTYIKYSKDQPRIEIYTADFANKWVYLWAIPIEDDRYIIYCPEGTVTQEFNIDLE